MTCIRCNNILKGWEDHHARGEIYINIAASLPDKVVHGTWRGSKERRGWDILEESPLVKSFHGQDLKMEFGTSLKTKLCNNCASKLAHTLGTFFRIGQASWDEKECCSWTPNEGRMLTSCGYSLPRGTPPMECTKCHKPTRYKPEAPAGLYAVVD